MKKILYAFAALALLINPTFAKKTKTDQPKIENSMTKSIEIYTTPTCVYCVKAKELLKKKSISYKEIDVTDVMQREAMIEKSGGKRSVPQIFIDGKHIGGYRELSTLDSDGRLSSETAE